jgi:hypothetical protein
VTASFECARGDQEPALALIDGEWLCARHAVDEAEAVLARQQTDRAETARVIDDELERRRRARR